MSFRGLDVVRALSAHTVLLAHLVQILVWPITSIAHWSHPVLTIAARLAVLAFLVVSGFVIAHSIAGNRRRNGMFHWRAYARSRCARILPPFWFAVLLTLVVAGIVQGLNLHGAESFSLPQDRYLLRSSLSLDFAQLVPTLLFLNPWVGDTALAANAPLWTLPYEVWMYALAALVLASPARGPAVRVFAIVTVVAVVVSQGWLGNLDFFLFAFAWCAGYGAYGVVAAAGAGRISLRVTVCARAAAIAFGAAFVFLLVRMPIDAVLDLDEARGMPPQIVFVLLLTALFALLGRSTRAGDDGAYGFDVVRGAARWSYTLYLIHFPLLLLVLSLAHQALHESPVWGRTAICVAAYVLICVLAARLARWLEDTERWRRLMFREARTRVVAPAGTQA